MALKKREIPHRVGGTQTRSLTFQKNKKITRTVPILKSLIFQIFLNQGGGGWKWIFLTEFLCYINLRRLVTWFITVQRHKYFYISNLWGKLLPAGMICATNDTIYTRGRDVFTCKNVLCTCSYVFYSHGCNKFLHARRYLHSLIPLLFSCL